MLLMRKHKLKMRRCGGISRNAALKERVKHKCLLVLEYSIFSSVTTNQLLEE